jgi:hypothetical protein
MQNVNSAIGNSAAGAINLNTGGFSIGEGKNAVPYPTLEQVSPGNGGRGTTINVNLNPNTNQNTNVISIGGQ